MTLSPKARALLDGANYLTVATVNPDGAPQSTVVWGRLDGEDLVFSTLKGRRKHLNLVRDPRVSVLVFDPANPFSTAELRGEVTIEDDPAGALIEELSQRYTGQGWTEKTPGAERVIVRVRAKKVVEH
ncbi:PPOX class F420-dependent oxidoreductase [Crossiella cryophila]|uniref:PPOX class probable F420-dependent enzyme n=1 Tax=Crossiella cryophila TaxID=43355 RepID=A0A7W7CKI3_9PSEU|nr:PPOX class F420-dependent oxidoreductase [Crossiella cryophila]MBB4681154.1 PPOX class probable F420-dependent enzyme [Crossiella cryophila]